MSHELVIDGMRRSLEGGAEIRDADTGAVLRVHALDGGHALVIATNAAAVRDGMPLRGRLTVVDRGSSALLRLGGTKAELCWQSRVVRRIAAAATRCRVCFGAFAAGEMAVVCVCAAPFHDACDVARVSCPECGGLRPDAGEAGGS
jgi:hypothetical protein